VACLIAGRTDELDRFEDIDLPRLQPRGLGVDDAMAVLRRTADVPIPEEVAARLVDLSCGNPLALMSFAELLAAEQLRGEKALPEVLPVDRSIQAAFARLLDALSPGTREALLLVAVGEPDDLPAIRAAASHRAIDIGWVAEAEAASLVRSGPGSIRFTHSSCGRRSSAARRRLTSATLMRSLPIT
jgi:hypothetical protein